jgi:hypothetical protein
MTKEDKEKDKDTTPTTMFLAMVAMVTTRLAKVQFGLSLAALGPNLNLT